MYSCSFPPADFMGIGRLLANEQAVKSLTHSNSLAEAELERNEPKAIEFKHEKVVGENPHATHARGGGGGAMLLLDDAAHPLIVFSAGLPGGIQLSQLPIPVVFARQWHHLTPMVGRMLWIGK
jgi:hypothetical protein